MFGGRRAVCSVQELKDKRERGDAFLLLDVREPEELALARLEGCTHVPMDDVPLRLDELVPWKDGEVVVLCHHGGRSAVVQQFLQRRGFTRVLNLAGGIDAYAAQVDPAIPRY